VEWLGGVTGGVNPIARLLLLLLGGKKNMMMSRQHKSAESCLSLTPPPSSLAVFLCPSHTILFFGGDGFLFFFPTVDQKVPSHHRPLVDKSIGPRRR
jgi:hypothetical protein